MAAAEKEEAPVLSDTQTQLSDVHTGVGRQRLTARTRSASMSIQMPSMDSYESNYNLVSHTDPLRNERQIPKTQMCGPIEFHNCFCGDVKGCMNKFFSFRDSFVPGIMNPHTKAVQQWHKFFEITCFVAIFLDPLFFFLLSAQEVNRCIVLNWPLAIVMAGVRSFTDFIYLMYMLLQFRLAYVTPESRVVDAGELVNQPKKIALNYLYGYFLVDLIVVLPVPQIMILFVLPKYVGSSAAYHARNLLLATVLLQCTTRLFRFQLLLPGRPASGFIFETVMAYTVIHLFIFVLAGHFVGSCWYLFGLQRVNQCLQEACAVSNLTECKKFIDCGLGYNMDEFVLYPDWGLWQKDTNVYDCFNKDGHFSYGIYQQAVNIATSDSIIARYTYSLFWGFQQISTLAGNLVPSYFVWEVLFTMAIIGVGLLLFPLLIGNMLNLLQALGRRRMEMQLRLRDIDQWISHEENGNAT